MKQFARILGLTCLCAAGTANAMSLEFPATSTPSGTDQEPMASYALPVGPAAAEGLPTLSVEGQVTRQAWHLDSASATTLQILAPLRDQLSAEGFETLYECDTATCGGFDFRYGTELLPEPAMHVNLGDFRYLSAHRDGADGPEHLGLMVSRAGQMGFVHLVRVGQPEAEPLPTVTTSTKTGPELPVAGDLSEQLEGDGRVVLSDLAFETGSSQLADAEFTSLNELADYLLDNPDRRIVLVGHTDAEGGLDGNIALSKKRATSVREKLVAELGVPGEQVDAQGVGYLVPLATNLTNDGRDLNRRVEAILNSTE